MKGVNYGRLLTVGTTSMDFTNPQLVRNIVLLATKITWLINRYVTIMSITKKKKPDTSYPLKSTPFPYKLSIHHISTHPFILFVATHMPTPPYKIQLTSY